MYAFTDCEVSISPNACVIVNEKPKFLIYRSDFEIYRHAGDRLLLLDEFIQNQYEDNIVIAGCSILDKNVSEFTCQNNLSGLEFLSCIPGSIGGGIRMNSGCFGMEFKDVLLSVQVMDLNGRVYTIN